MAASPKEKALARGLLPSSKTTLYTVPTGYRSDHINIILVNTDTVARTCNIYIGDGSNSYRITPKALSLDPGFMCVLDDQIVYNDGDRIEGDASTASVISYIIAGNE